MRQAPPRRGKRSRMNQARICRIPRASPETSWSARLRDSTSSRNFSLGKAIGEGGDAAQLLADRRTVAEGAFTAPVLSEAARKAGIDMPITEAVCALLEGASAEEVVKGLLARPLKPEA